MSSLESYFVEFDLKRNIKNKIYLNNCQLNNANFQNVIIVTYDKCMFSANNKKTYR